MTATADRFLSLEGCVNFRDLGGYETADGRRLRWRRVFRSDSLHRLTETDALALADLGLVTAIDLRTQHERDRVGLGVLVDRGVEYVHASMIDQSLNAGEATVVEWKTKTLTDLYETMLRRAGPAYVTALDVIADPARHPVVLFCMAGKDRTGLLSAVLLSLLGVPDEAIVSDYSLTESVVEGIMERHRREAPEMEEVWKDLPPDVGRAPAAAMAGVLERLRDEHGSVEGWVASIGVPPDTRDRLRSVLLEPG